MDHYLLGQIDARLIEAWNRRTGETCATPSEVLRALRATPVSRSFHDATVDAPGGRLCFFTSGTSGQETFFRMSADKLFGKYSQGLGEVYQELFNIVDHRLDTAVVAFPLDGSPLGMKHVFAFLELGVDVFPAGNRNLDFTPLMVARTIDRFQVQVVVSRPLEVEIYARIAAHCGYNLESVMAILMTGEVVGTERLKRIGQAFPNAIVRSVYGLTEINSGLFSCESGNYHFRRNGQTLVEVEARMHRENGRIHYTVLRPDFHAIRYNTRDLGHIVPACSCSQGGSALCVKGRDSDEIAPDWFLADLSDHLRALGYDLNIFADMDDSGGYRIILRTDPLLSAQDSAWLKVRLPKISIVNPHLDLDLDYVPRTKSCTLHRGVSKYEYPHH